MVLVGPSGCGKSTLLRMIAGLEEISGGEIRIGEQRVNDVPPKERDIAMVFQNYALYPHMTVRENMAFALMLAKPDKATIEAKVSAPPRSWRWRALLERYPRQLSGGQRQRVAMGRAIVRDPQVFLFDEPLSNLDAKLRVAMRSEIKELHQRLKTTSIYVTHDQIEAMTMGDRIVVMRDGRIEQVGSPLELYDHPANHVRRRLHRLAGDELPAGRRCAAAAARPGSSWRTARSSRRRPPPAATTASRSSSAPGPSTCALADEGGIAAARRRDGADRHRHLRRLPPRGAELAAVFRERHDFAPGSTIHLHARPRARASLRRRHRRAARRLSDARRASSLAFDNDSRRQETSR